MSGQRQNQQQLQSNLQITDDTWGRLISALERLEAVTENPNSVATYQKDSKRDQRNIEVYRQEDKVQLQIEAFRLVVSPVRDYAESWLLQDFIYWMGKRNGFALNYTDDYAIPVLQCILDGKFRLLETPDLVENLPSGIDHQQDTLQAVEGLGAGLQETDKIAEEFARNPNKQSSFGNNHHKRGDFRHGMDRIKEIAEEKGEKPWFKRFVNEQRWQSEHLDSNVIQGMLRFVENLFNW